MIIMKEYIIFYLENFLKFDMGKVSWLCSVCPSSFRKTIFIFLSSVNESPSQRPAVDCAEADVKAFSKFLKTTADLLLFFYFSFFNFMLTEQIS